MASFSVSQLLPKKVVISFLKFFFRGPFVLWRWEFDEHSVQYVHGERPMDVHQRMLDRGHRRDASAAGAGALLALGAHGGCVVCSVAVDCAGLSL